MIMSIDVITDPQNALDREPDPGRSAFGVTLHRIDPARNMARFYAMDMQHDLFGAILLMRQWGRIGTYGRVAAEVYASMAIAIAALECQAERKRRRGYR
jgi:predicted DNA-binding WGR domain protein